jgi:hypothetical protein
MRVRALGSAGCRYFEEGASGRFLRAQRHVLRDCNSAAANQSA